MPALAAREICDSQHGFPTVSELTNLAACLKENMDSQAISQICHNNFKQTQSLLQSVLLQKGGVPSP
jgi:hypothetical protein